MSLSPALTQQLAEAYGTPLNVLDEDVLRGGVRAFDLAFSARWPGPVRVLPAIKAGTILQALRALRSETAGCDLFSEGELDAALRTGFDPHQMSLNGNGKLASPDLLDRAINAGVRLTVDDLGELPVIEQAAKRLDRIATIRLRMRPDLHDYWKSSQFLAPAIPTHVASQAYKAGMPLPDLLIAGRRVLDSPHLSLTGLHLHLGRHRSDLKYWRSAMRAAAVVVRRCLLEWPGWQPLELDIGGGFAGPGDAVGSEHSLLAESLAMRALGALPAPMAGVRDRLVGRVLNASRQSTSHGREVATPTADDYAEVVCRTLSDELHTVLDLSGVTLEVEPGRAIYTAAGHHIARVTGIKRQTSPLPWMWVFTDTSTAFVPDGLTELVRYWASVPGREPSTERVVADLVGMSCTADRIVGDLDLPADVAVGDLVVIDGTGAYNEMAASNFNSLPRPATVCINHDGHRLARRRETIDDVFARDIEQD